MTANRQPILILGAGINGVALARELLLNRVPVVLVDTADLCSGASAYSSRLIHGGLRYLEYGEFDLVRQSLDERGRLLRLAPQFVKPLQLYIPARRRLGGLWPTLTRFLLGRSTAAHRERGMWLVRCGLWMYDRFAASDELPAHDVRRSGTGTVPRVNKSKYPWVCSYWDAQILNPERFVVAMLQDTQSLATGDCPFRFLTYHRPRMDGTTVEIVDVATGQPTLTVNPAAIVNATGAWVDRTLEQLRIPTDRLMGGTSGSHFITYHERLRAALGPAGVYVEAADGRPVFLLPFGEGVLVGTTDVSFEGDPADARATDGEIEYLIETVNEVIPDLQLSPHDVVARYCGVRPLPYSQGTAAGAITRRHQIHRHDAGPIPLYSLIGGKLTTCRALGEETAAMVLNGLELATTTNTRDRPLPGGANFPVDREEEQRSWKAIADELGFSIGQVQVTWQLLGTRAKEVLSEARDEDKTSIVNTDLPLAVVRWMIDNEWVVALGDLIQRRLMLAYDPRLTVAGVRQLAQIMLDAGRLSPADVDDQVDQAISELREKFARRLE
ncbi:MAG: glycerol-3-phosphate dehydrogenase/oxidase [Pirellulales bacterium]|nr:glycerol-3-phosphate dehydrogenase/oxidase [Pirellulales bacterium]